MVIHQVIPVILLALYTFKSKQVIGNILTTARKGIWLKNNLNFVNHKSLSYLVYVLLYLNLIIFENLKTTIF